MQFLLEKSFVRPLPPLELERLRAAVGTVRCNGCGAAIDLAKDPACRYCRAPVAVLDPDALAQTVAALSAAETARHHIDPVAMADALMEAERFNHTLADRPPSAATPTRSSPRSSSARPRSTSCSRSRRLASGAPRPALQSALRPLRVLGAQAPMHDAPASDKASWRAGPSSLAGARLAAAAPCLLAAAVMPAIADASRRRSTCAARRPPSSRATSASSRDSGQVAPRGEWSDDFSGYIECLKGYIGERNATIEANSKAAKTAVEEFNTNVDEFNEQIKSLSE